MAQVAGQRMAAEIDGDFVVFSIGARLNKFRLLASLMDLGGRRGMQHMLDYLTAHPDKGPLWTLLRAPQRFHYRRRLKNHMPRLQD